jgi:hypothetical protein
MKFIVTYVPVLAKTRKRHDKARSTVVDTAATPYDGTTDPVRVELIYELLNATETVAHKVIDVRETR